MALQNNKITLRNAQSGEFKLVSRLLVAAYQQYEKSMPRTAGYGTGMTCLMCKAGWRIPN